jgi:N-acetylmuramoyl-L-alanine amidase
MKTLSYFHNLPIYFLIGLTLTCQIISHKHTIWDRDNLGYPKSYSELISTQYYGPIGKQRSYRNVTAIIIHTTKGLQLQEFLEKSWSNQWNVHILISQKGIVYGESIPENIEYPTAPGIDPSAIHIVLEGKVSSILSNSLQFRKTFQIVSSLRENFSIVPNNWDVGSRAGVFTHNQVKKKFGGFIDLKEYGEDQILEKLLSELGGQYFLENDWKDRFEKNWVLRKENIKSIKRKFQPNRGRGISDTPFVELKSIEQNKDGTSIDSHRIKYEFKEKINPTCLVLHYTAISTYFNSLAVLEGRGLNATFLVDTDGKAYQLLDNLNHLPATAFGTNEHCVQMEIVGKNTEELIKNEIQMNKVVELTQELSKLLQFPLSNKKIEEFSGVYSHTQAKKKMGGSIFLTADDFDPGEAYMKLILEKSGGTYFPEKDWFERQSNSWAILDRKFQP